MSVEALRTPEEPASAPVALLSLPPQPAAKIPQRRSNKAAGRSLISFFLS